MHSLPLFLKLRDRPVILLGEGPMADAKARLLELAGARIKRDEGATAAIAVIAIGEGAEPVAVRLKARGMLVNVVDQPTLSDFTFPAIVDRDPVVVAIGTGGASAGLSAALRQRLEAILPAGLGRVASALHAARDQLRARFPELDDRRRAIADMLASGGSLDPMNEPGDLETAIAAADFAAPRLERIAVRSVDPDELSLRAARLLGLADRLYAGPGVPGAILDRARADAIRLAAPAPAEPEPGLSVELEWVAA